MVELGVVKLAILISFGHLLILIVFYFLAGRVAPGSLGNRPNDPIVIALEPLHTLYNFERCVVRRIDLIGVGTRQ